jgi:hypothetical protein
MVAGSPDQIEGSCASRLFGGELAPAIMIGWRQLQHGPNG